MKKENTKKGLFKVNFIDFQPASSLTQFLFGINDIPEMTIFGSLRYALITRILKKKLHKDIKKLPEAGYQRVFGWTATGKKVFDITEKIPAVGLGSSAFSASGHASEIKKRGGYVMGWLKPEAKINIWPTDLVIFQASQSLIAL